MRESVVASVGRILTAAERDKLLQQWGVQEKNPEDIEADVQTRVAEATKPLLTEVSTLKQQLERATSEHAAAVQSLEANSQSMQDSATEREALLTRVHQLEDAAAAASQVSSHPVYGLLVHDFGYKQVYAATVGHLEDMDIWEHQRVFSQKRHALPVATHPCTCASDAESPLFVL